MRATILKTAAVIASMMLDASVVSAAPTALQKCEASKNRAAGAYYSCREKAEATAITKAVAPDYGKCTAKFDDKWGDAETKGAGECPDDVMTAPMNAFIAAQAAETASVIAGAPIPDCAEDLSACEAELAACEAGGGSGGLPATGQMTAYGTGSDGDVRAGVARSFTDNGDGTITDEVTGLMWEKKSDDGSIHDKDNFYTWGEASPPYSMNGTMVTTFLANLNSDGGFAGYTDWRVPNLFELFSLVNLEAVSPSTYSAFDTGCAAACTVLTCSCTQPDTYWSSTTYRGSPSDALFVYLGGGGTSGDYKAFGRFVRAVRSGP